jgi:MFS family permease
MGSMGVPAPRLEPHPGGAPARGFPWYVAGVAAWFGAFGMQQVLFAWLVVGELRAEARWVGVAQSAAMVPNFLLILLGGALADRRDRRALLVRLHLLATALALGLSAAVAGGALSLALLIAYALAIDSVSAFVLPARDALLSEVAGENLMRAVTALTLVQWTAQAAGALVGGSARWIGTAPALGLLAATYLAGAPSLARLAKAPPRAGAPPAALRLADLGVGVREVLRSPRLRPVVILVAAVGALFVGPMLVVLPLLIRDHYAGDVAQLGLLQTCFPIGTILGSLALLARGGVRRKGLAQVAALVFGSACLGSVGLGLPLWGTLLAVALWGLGAALFMNAGRTVFQEQAPAAHRGSVLVLAVYMLGFLGASGLVGAPVSGLLVGWLGPLATCLTASAAMLAVVALVVARTEIARVE